MAARKAKEVVADLSKKHGGKTLSGATVLFLFGLVFNDISAVEFKVNEINNKINSNHIELIREIQTGRQETTGDKMNYFSVIKELFEEIKEMKMEE